MKFYSEITGKMYDTIEELETSEKKTMSADKVCKLFDEMANKQIEIIRLAQQVVEITNEDFVVPKTTICVNGSTKFEFPNGETTILDKTGMITASTMKSPEIEPMTTKSNQNSAPAPDTGAIKIKYTDEKEKLDALVNFLESLGKHGKVGNASFESMTPHPTIKAKKLSDNEVKNLMDVLDSL